VLPGCGSWLLAAGVACSALLPSLEIAIGHHAIQLPSPASKTSGCRQHQPGRSQARWIHWRGPGTLGSSKRISRKAQKPNN